jgi:hypothetical protein
MEAYGSEFTGEISGLWVLRGALTGTDLSDAVAALHAESFG